MSHEHLKQFFPYLGKVRKKQPKPTGRRAECMRKIERYNEVRDLANSLGLGIDEVSIDL